MRYITLLRHGQTSQPGRYHGLNDVSLSDAGRTQMRVALAECAADITRIISSPLLRCAEVAQNHAASNNLPIELNPAWVELDFGTWTGRSAAEIMQHEAEYLSAFWRDPLLHAPPAGETLQHAASRIQAAWDALPTDENLLIVTHGGVMRLLFCQLLGLPLTQLWHIDIHYAACMTWLSDASGTRLHHLHAGHAV
ncbi:MAG: histidine phosphatase family protein [Halothiobacillaceae bacterium]|nr:histidine phosphatase family protein [Halothiobacillaceae bacterium]